MLRHLIITAVFGGLAFTTVSAQTPYAGMQARTIKALSSQQIADLRAGRGMGLALPAELNGYPGPSHLLELADRIGLTDEQRQAIRRLFDDMKAETIPIGEQLIAQEMALDSVFADRRATAENVAALTTDIGSTQAKLRAAHLRYHLSTLGLLQPSQVERYAELRGYTEGGAAQHHHGR
jgi:Spy/CpxP family protein refolding chaperone